MFHNRVRSIHFVGIGGIGMSGIAEVLCNLGYHVSGSDMQASPVTERLQSLGAVVYVGHEAERVHGTDVVVTSTAVSSQNPEVLEARALGIPVIPRAEMLAELMRLKYGIAVAGTHGKTTTTSLIATVLQAGGIDPTVVIGGRLKSISSNARLGTGDYLVAEADESDGSFLRLMPTIAVVTNIDAEHLEHWKGGIQEITDAFLSFVRRVPFYGAAVMCLDHPVVASLLPQLDKRVITYGLTDKADLSAHDVRFGEGRVTFHVRKHGEPMGDIDLALIGNHNVQNALACIAVADDLGVSFDVIREALRTFGGIGRRFEIKGTVNDIMVVDDYGHHPAEVLATLQAARDSWDRRLVVAFQPHRYTRTRDMMQDFATAFCASDVLLVADIYAAGETPIEGISSSVLADVIRAKGHPDVTHVASLDEIAKRLDAIAKPGDLILTLGAGTIWRVGEAFLAMR